MMSTAIAEFAPKSVKPKSKNLVPIQLEEDKSTKNTSVAFFLLPEWAKNFPPYNIARLAALTKLNGYKTWAFDINVKAWRDSFNWGLDYDPWHFGRDWKWYPDEYFKDIHPNLEPLLKSKALALYPLARRAYCPKLVALFVILKYPPL